mmetsp:Transcript_40476/g.56973  ORF Transcript_40476/g.56973 Transcript_40476/m.56973 type:complete len:100 (+) Transcript_40476:832-1131(+)
MALSDSHAQYVLLSSGKLHPVLQGFAWPNWCANECAAYLVPASDILEKGKRDNVGMECEFCSFGFLSFVSFLWDDRCSGLDCAGLEKSRSSVLLLLMAK